MLNRKDKCYATGRSLKLGTFMVSSKMLCGCTSAAAACRCSLFSLSTKVPNDGGSVARALRQHIKYIYKAISTSADGHAL